MNLDAIGLKYCISYSKFWIEQYSQCVCCAQKKLILFLDWKAQKYGPCNSYKWIKMHSELKSIYFNICESMFLKIHFNSFQSIFICWALSGFFLLLFWRRNFLFCIRRTKKMKKYEMLVSVLQTISSF